MRSIKDWYAFHTHLFVRRPRVLNTGRLDASQSAQLNYRGQGPCLGSAACCRAEVQTTQRPLGQPLWLAQTPMHDAGHVLSDLGHALLATHFEVTQDLLKQSLLVKRISCRRYDFRTVVIRNAVTFLSPKNRTDFSKLPI